MGIVVNYMSYFVIQVTSSLTLKGRGLYSSINIVDAINPIILRSNAVKIVSLNTPLKFVCSLVLGTLRNIIVILAGVFFYGESVTINESIGYTLALIGFVG
jgi:hypothetical protein